MKMKIKKKLSLYSSILILPPFKIFPPEKCPVLQSLLFIFFFSSSSLSSILLKYLFSLICLFSFYLFQFCSNFSKYSSSNFLSSYPYSNFTIYFPSNSILLYFFLFAFLSPTCYFTSAPNLPLKSFTNSFAFFKSSSFSYVSFSAVNLFHHTKYFSTPLIFLLFKIFSTSHSSTLSTLTGFSSFFFCPFTCSLYCTT